MGPYGWANRGHTVEQNLTQPSLTPQALPAVLPFSHVDPELRAFALPDPKKLEGVKVWGGCRRARYGSACVRHSLCDDAAVCWAFSEVLREAVARVSYLSRCSCEFRCGKWFPFSLAEKTVLL